MTKKAKNNTSETSGTKKKPKKAREKTAKISKKQAHAPSSKQGLVYRIWLAGIGAYGKTRDVTADGLGKVSKKGSAMFDDLVRRGEAIEDDMRDRIGANKAVSDLTEQVVRAGNRVVSVTEDASVAVSRFQRKQLEGLEKHMKRMRDALAREAGFMKAKKATKLGEKLKRLQRDVAQLQRDVRGGDSAVVARIDDLSVQVETAGRQVRESVQAKRASDQSSARSKLGPVAPPVNAADDLKRIKGVGVMLERKLNAAGICRFSQLAGLTRAQMAQLDVDLKLSGRMERDNWIAQASALARAGTDDSKTDL